MTKQLPKFNFPGSGLYAIDLELSDDTMLDMIGPVFSLNSLDFVITNKSREGTIAICVTLISLFLWP